MTYLDTDRVEREWGARIPRPPLKSLIDHIDHIAKVAGVDGKIFVVIAGTSEGRLCSELGTRCKRASRGRGFLGSVVCWDECGQPFFEVLDQRGQGLWVQSRNPDRAVALTEDLRLPGRKLIAFVEHQDLWELIESEALQHGVNRCDMGVQIFGPRIDHMEEEVGIA